MTPSNIMIIYHSVRSCSLNSIINVTPHYKGRKDKAYKHKDKLVKSKIIIDFKNYSYFALYFDYIYSVLRNYLISKEKYCENIFNLVTGSMQTRCLFLCANCKQLLYTCSCISPRISDQNSTIHSNLLHNDNN